MYGISGHLSEHLPEQHHVPLPEGNCPFIVQFFSPVIKLPIYSFLFGQCERLKESK